MEGVVVLLNLTLYFIQNLRSVFVCTLVNVNTKNQKCTNRKLHESTHGLLGGQAVSQMEIIMDNICSLIYVEV